MQRQLISEQQQGNFVKCNVCIQLISKNKNEYRICKNRHLACLNCIKGQIDHNRCPICLVPIQPNEKDFNQQMFELIAWDQVMQLGAEDVEEGRQYSRLHYQPRQSKGSHQNFALGAASSFGEFHQHQGDEQDHQPFFGVIKIDIRGYLALLGIQLVLTLLNFYFGLSRINQQICPLHELSYTKTIVYQSWLMGIGILELIFMSFTLLFLLFYRGRCISQQEFGSCWKIIKTIFGIKIVLWSIIQLVIFIKGIPDNCTQGLHTFGMINALLHVFLLSAVIAELGKLRRKLLPFALQFYIAFFNIYYGFTNTQQLVKQQFRNDISNYQNWLKIVGIFECCFMLLVVFFFRLKNCGIKTGKMSLIIKWIYGAKIALWLCIQIYTLTVNNTQVQNCQGGLYLYSIVNTILHVIFIIVVFRNKK